MINLFTAATPNGQKIHIALEETGLPYQLTWVDIGRGDQFNPEFLTISPNNKIPAIIDPNGPGGAPLPLFESGAILLYLAEKTGKLIPTDAAARYECVQWLMFQMGGVGPMLGQAHHFLHFNPEASEYASQRYANEVKRLYGVMDKRLDDARYLAGDDYSIADMATWPWLSRFEWQGIDLNKYPNVRRWYVEISERPAVQKGYDIPDKAGDIPMPP